MALQRKPVKSNAEPTYPDSQAYANDRRDFLVKLGLTAAGLISLAGCGEATRAQTNALQDPAPTPVTSSAPPVINQSQPVAPITAMPGAPPAPQNIPTTITPQPVNATPQACTPGKPSAASLAPAPVQPQTAVPGGVSVALPQAQTPAPALPQAQSKGDTIAPVRPQAVIRGEASVPLHKPAPTPPPQSEK